MTSQSRDLQAQTSKTGSDAKGNVPEPYDNFTDLARRLFAVPKHELDEEIAKEKAEGVVEKPARKPKPTDRKKAA